MVIIAIILLVILLLEVLIRFKVFSRNKESYTFSGKLNRYILTNNEKIYYYALKDILKDTEYLLFSKVRMADIIRTYSERELNKVKGKHIDFIICDKDTRPILFIELDDSTHNRKINSENDRKKDYILSKVGINIIRTTIKDMNKNLFDIKEKLGI